MKTRLRGRRTAPSARSGSRGLGKSEFLAYQASRRGGEVRVRVDGDRVLLGGQAVTVLRGTLV